MVANTFYYLVFAFNYEIETVISISNVTFKINNNISLLNIINSSRSECQLKTATILALSYVDFANKFIFSCSILAILSIILIRMKAIKSKKRIWQNYSSTENKTFKRDLKLANVSIIINFALIVLNLPNFFLSYVSLIGIDLNLWRTFTFNLYYASFSFKFYIMLILNSSFKKAFLTVFSNNFCRIDPRINVQA